VVKKAAKLGMPAVAMTDHGNLFGAIDFYMACKKAKIKPIIGCELYVCGEGRSRPAANSSWHFRFAGGISRHA